MGIYRDVFDLAAKVGCLEGYLYEQPQAAPQYLPNWLANIHRMYSSLPEEARADFLQRYVEVLDKAAGHMEKLLGANDSNVFHVKEMLAEARGWNIG